MPRYKVSIDAKYSDEYVLVAKDAAEAKKKAVERFAKTKNFNLYARKIKPGQEPWEVL